VRNGETQNDDFPSRRRWIIDSTSVAVRPFLLQIPGDLKKRLCVREFSIVK